MPLFYKKYVTTLSFCVVYITGNAQITIPWSSSLNVNFGRGSTNPGPSLPVGKTDFTYTTDLCPSKGNYTIVHSASCGYALDLPIDATITYNGIFQNAFPDSSGYMMLVNAGISANPQVVFQDSVKNLCSNTGYLFWAALTALQQNYCSNQSFTFSIETTDGVIIKSWVTGNFGKDTNILVPPAGSQAEPETGYAFYFNYFTSLNQIIPKSTFPFFYGFFFTPPPNVRDVVAKIMLNPSSAYIDCIFSFALDNIIIMPVSSQIHIANPIFPEGWIIGACFQGDKPIILNGSINYDSLFFGSSKFAGTPYANPAFQWQRSVDDGYTWTDIPGETGINLAHSFNSPDTFLIRLRGADASNINNLNCNVTSNVIKAQVDGLPKDFSFTSNSPVCEDSDIVLKLTGGASYTTFGPNGFTDNSAFPHVYHPLLADSGWYYSYITSYGGCMIKDSTYVLVKGPDLKIGASDSACYGAPFQLSSSGGVAYLWTPATGLSNASISSPIAFPHMTTKYTVKVTDPSGCSAFGYQTVVLKDTLLKALFNLAQYACPHDNVAIQDSSIGKIESWNWNFGNGETSHLQDPHAQTYLTPGNLTTKYEVKLIVTDSSGCSDSAFRIISAVPNCFIAVPSAFTPNGDGQNDYLHPLNLYKATNITFRVFNRFGQLLFESHDMYGKWDGSVSGLKQPAGAYVWTLDYNDESNKRISGRGTTILIR